MHQIEVDDEIQQFDGGTGKDGVENPYKKVDAFAANTFRNLLPVPDNVAQMIAKTTFGDARMNNKSLDDKQKIILWNTTYGGVVALKSKVKNGKLFHQIEVEE
jgi:hypothetical protein